MELKQYIQFLWRWWWLLALLGGLLGSVAYALSSRQTPFYEATTTLMVNQVRPELAAPSIDALRARDRIALTYAVLLSRRPILEETIANLNLNTSPGLLASRINVKLVDNTELLKLSVSDPNPEHAARIADEIVTVFNRQLYVDPNQRANPYASSTSLRVIELAQPNWNPVSPQTTRDMLLAAFIGVLLGIAIGFLRDYFDDRLKSREDVERLTGLPALAAIGQIAGANLPDKLVTVTTANEPVAEAYRMFRAHLDLAANGAPLRTIVVTSSLPNEGKSLTVANLAAGLAQTGKRVILVDANLRRPTLHTFFRRNNGRGLTNALAQPGEGRLSDYLMPTSVDNLLLLPSGPVATSPAKLLGAAHFATLVEELKTQADVIIFDSPALLPVVDTSLLLGVCDAALLVARASATRAVQVNQARDQILQSEKKLLGVWLNGVARARRSYRDHYTQFPRIGGQRRRAWRPMFLPQGGRSTVSTRHIADETGAVGLAQRGADDMKRTDAERGGVELA